MSSFLFDVSVFEVRGAIFFVGLPDACFMTPYIFWMLPILLGFISKLDPVVIFTGIVQFCRTLLSQLPEPLLGWHLSLIMAFHLPLLNVSNLEKLPSKSYLFFFVESFGDRDSSIVDGVSKWVSSVFQALLCIWEEFPHPALRTSDPVFW